jgi:hypothetical protein
MSLNMLDFDKIDDWASDLTVALRRHVPMSVEQTLVEGVSEDMYIEDVRNWLFDLTNRDAVIDTVLSWLRSRTVAGYHGSRLTDEEVNSIQENGLIPLKSENRRDRLTKALSPHPRWLDVKDRLDGIIQDIGQGCSVGRREGQVHLTLSRAGLTHRFNHYLKYGSEFDQHVTKELLEEEGTELLANYGKPRVFKVAVPGHLALKAAHPFFTIEDLRDRGDLPNIAKEFLESWTYRLAYPNFESKTLGVDCGMVFYEPIPAVWVKDLETLSGI